MTHLELAMTIKKLNKELDNLIMIELKQFNDDLQESLKAKNKTIEEDFGLLEISENDLIQKIKSELFSALENTSQIMGNNLQDVIDLKEIVKNTILEEYRIQDKKIIQEYLEQDNQIKVVKNPIMTDMLSDMLGLSPQEIENASLSQRVAWFLKVNAMFCELSESDDDKVIKDKIKRYLNQLSISSIVQQLPQGNYFVTTCSFNDNGGYSNNELRVTTESNILNIIGDGDGNSVGIYKGCFHFDINFLFVFEYIVLPDIVKQQIFIGKDNYDNIESIVYQQLNNSTQTFGGLPLNNQHNLLSFMVK